MLIVALAATASGTSCRCADEPRQTAAPEASVTKPAPGASSTSMPASASASASASAAAPAAPVPVRVEQIEVPGDLPVFVVRGKPDGERMVFVHGLCGHPHAYAHSFMHAAARIGTMIAIQGNVGCGPGYRRWSSTPAKVDARIEAAFRAIGDESALLDLIVIGYSSGGTYAELLAMRSPDRYTRAVLIANPREPQFHRLKGLRAAVMMAGERDRHDLMKAGNRVLRARGIPSTFMVLPGATHGEMGSQAERVMGDALDWLLRHQKKLPGGEPSGAPPPT